MLGTALAAFQVFCLSARSAPLSGAPAAEAHAFILQSGVNLPWIRYGWDLGANPWGGEPGGFHANRDRLASDFDALRDSHVKVCRVFLFWDFRSGLERDAQGSILGLDDFVAHDMAALLDVATASGIRLIPVLMDYMLADGVAYENGVPVGEYTEYITDPTMREQLFEHALMPFLLQFGNHESVYAWDVMNEPRLATAVSQTQIRFFVEAVAGLIREAAPGARVTIGHYDRYHLEDYGNAAVDLTQIHYYSHMGSYWDFDTPADWISSKPTFFGEVEPIAIENKLDTALRNTYNGILFWSLNAGDGYDFASVAGDYAEWVTDVFVQTHENMAITGLHVTGWPPELFLEVAPTYPLGRYRLESRASWGSDDWRTETTFTGVAGSTSTSIPLPETPRLLRVLALF